MNQTGWGLVREHSYWHRLVRNSQCREAITQFIKDIDAYEAARLSKAPAITAEPADVEDTGNPELPFWCGKGWYPLIHEALEEIRAYDPDVKISLIKQKMGELRMYTKSTDERVYHVIEEARKQSLKTCEICGKPGSVRIRGGGIKKTVCSECLTKV